MSHFTVLVIGDNPEEQLAPYDENIEKEPYVRGEITEDEWASFMAYYVKENPAHGVLTKEQLYEMKGKDWNNNEWKFDEIKQQWFEWSTYNPDSKWDWYQLGGRWKGFFKLKVDGMGMVGESGVFDNEGKPGWVDRAMIGDIDFEGMHLDRADQARATYKEVMVWAGGKLEAPARSWEEIRKDESYGEDWDKRREDYWQQPEMQVWKTVSNKMHFWNTPIDDFLVTEEEYVQRAAKAAIATFAVVKDGTWYEKGQMGWFGTSFNEMKEEDWVDKFHSLLDGLPEDTILSLYDCHI